MVQDYESATNLRLPTEAEWEYACRAGSATAFYNGSNTDASLPDLAWFATNAGAVTRPVGLKTANALGFHDVLGNVMEWCEDWYADDYYAQSDAVDPAGPPSGTRRVVRGGWCGDVSYYCRTSYRNKHLPSFAPYDAGFRVARTP